MKIFSNFDTKLRASKREEYVQQYGAENTTAFGRSRLYWRIKIFIPSILILVVSLILLVLFYRWFNWALLGYAIAVCCVFDLALFFPIIGKYIDYKMDFIIVTPESLMLYSQHGIFKRDTTTLNVVNIKTISIQKDKFLYSVFNNGDIVILSESDIPYGEVTLRWIPRPEKRRNKIANIIWLDKKEATSN